MVAPWQETQYRVVVEFKKGGHGAHRQIDLTHNAQQPVIPPQLHGRVSPEAWGLFMTDMGQLALVHPYVQRPSAEYCCSWMGAFLSMLVVGFGCFPGEDHGHWVAQLNAALARHRPAFAHGGCSMSVQSVHGSFWVQVDVDPRAVAVGAPVAAAPVAYAPYPAPQQPYPAQQPYPGQQPYPAQQPYPGQQPPGYPPAKGA